MSRTRTASFGAVVEDRYSTEEVGYVALQCPDHEHMHTMGDSLLVEVVDALLGLSTDVVQQLSGVMVATCDEAGQLLEEAPKLVRSLTTSVAATAAMGSPR